MTKLALKKKCKTIHSISPSGKKKLSNLRYAESKSAQYNSSNTIEIPVVKKKTFKFNRPVKLQFS